MVSFSMTFDNRVSRSLYTYKSNITKLCVLGTKLLKNTNRKLFTIYRMVIIIIIIRAFVRRTMSASELNLRCRQSLDGEDG